MKISKSIKKVGLACILTFFMVSAYFHFRVMNIVGLLTTNATQLNIQEAVSTGLETKDKKSYSSISQDPNLEFNNVEKKVSNIVIYISDMNVVNMKAQLYIDNGTGFSEGNSHFFRLRKGANRIKLRYGATVKSIRLDPTVVQNQAFTLSKIVINEPNMGLLLYAFPAIFIAMVVALYRGKQYKINIIIITILSYNFIKVIDVIEFDTIKKVIVCIVLIAMFGITSMLFSLLYDNYTGGENEELYKTS